jgi:Uma2 family endonuclease
MSTALPAAATLDDLMRADGKAELIGGKVVPLMLTGFHPGRIGGRIFRSLDDYTKQTGRGVALPDNVGYAVSELSSGRESFAPDASFFDEQLPSEEMDFIEGPPTLAVEVRSKNDHGDAAEEAMAAKRADYFEAGTIVVWDIDSVAEIVRVYRHTSPESSSDFGRGQMVDAEPAVPGWRMAVDEMLAS